VIENIRPWFWILIIGVVAPAVTVYVTAKVFLAAYRTNHISWRFGTISRLEHPIGFWLMILFYLSLDATMALCIVAMTTLAIRRL
jgi:hypothetical protein